MKYLRLASFLDFEGAWDIAATHEPFEFDTKSIKQMRRKSILKVSIRQLKAARALLAWSQPELAAAAGISVPTIKRLEAQEGPLGGRNETASKIQLALEAAGIEFIDENGGGPGVRLRKREPKKTK
jgi:DNA-binding XRE family transcriptional regulator